MNLSFSNFTPFGARTICFDPAGFLKGSFFSYKRMVKPFCNRPAEKNNLKSPHNTYTMQYSKTNKVMCFEKDENVINHATDDHK